MADTRNDAARWTVLTEQKGAVVREYETARKRWLAAATSGEYAQAEADMNRLARDIAGQVALLMGVEL